jgi:ABC-type phosphate transport system substrate-binding protein
MHPPTPIRQRLSHIRHAPILLCIVCLCDRSLRSQTTPQLPLYEPRQQVSGTIRIGCCQHHDVLLKNWEEGFQAVQPGVRFENSLKSTANAISALSFGIVDIGIVDRGILPLETLEFRRELLYPPTEFAVATGSYDVTLETAAFAANRTYPLSRSIYMYVNRASGKPLDPAIEEFLRYVLSRDGQRQVSRQNAYYPLTPALVQAGLNTLHQSIGEGA